MQNTQPVDEQALKASGMIGAGELKPKRVRVKKVLRVTGDVLSSGAKIAAHAAPLLFGLGDEKKAKQPSEWNTSSCSEKGNK